MSQSKYKELYEHTVNILEEERNRFNRIDNKAAIFLTALSIIISISVYFIKTVIIDILPPTSPTQGFIVILASLLIISLFIAWYENFKVLKISGYKRMPLTEEMVEFYKENRLIDIYNTLAKENLRVYKCNLVGTKDKLTILVKGYVWIQISGVLLLLFIFSYGYYIWNQ